jgi:hypothetical protein
MHHEACQAFHRRQAALTVFFARLGYPWAIHLGEAGLAG